MTSQSNSVLNSSLKSFPRASSFIVIIVGCLVLVGWAFDIAALKSVLPGLVTMKANTALAFVLAGMSLWLLQSEQADQRMRRIAQTYALTVACLGLLTLSQYLFGWDLGIDQLLFQDLQTTDPITSQPGRMAPSTALNFLLLGAALLLLDVETRRGHCPAQGLILVATLISVIAIIGYAYGVQALYNFPAYSSMALHTAAAFLLLSVGLLYARPNRGLMVVISSSNVGGLTARRLLPAVVLIVFGLGWLRLIGQQAGLYEVEFGLALMVTFSMAALTVVIWHTAKLLDRTDTERQQAEKTLRIRHQELLTLYEVSQDVMSSSDLKSTLETVLDKTLAISAFDMGNTRVFDDKGNLLQGAYKGYRDPENQRMHHSSVNGPNSGKLVPRVVASRKTFVVEDVPGCDGLRTLKREGVQSVIILPIYTSDEELGVIQIGSRTPRKFLPYEVRLLEAISSQMGIAVQKSRLFEETKRNLERIQVLREIDQAITSTLNLDAILSLLLEKIDPFLRYPFASTVMLLNRETHQLEPAACRHLDETEWRRHLSDPVHGRGNQWIVLETKAPLKVLNVQTHPQTRHPGFMGGHGLVSFLGVPLTAKGETLGVLSIYAKEEHDFTDEEVGLLTDLANQASLAIHNAQLYEEMSKLAANLSKANTVKDQFLSVMSHELR